ncbi:hypothetical protein [Acidianus manzaensis]|uniref:Metal-dependent hydrolase n=1 Tax=Acidianus manzaensis TaxID=282676 RepID=A0A1W6K0V4_9CREN|nr:hypothetical protein [Acidianus manzaensis]ARM76149.1 hypothetical protein B6F84_09045 [Acidianus manzaensis]
MFIGHFAVAFLLHYFFPMVPLWIPLLGVSFPDLLWPVFIILGVEIAHFDSNSPLQKNIDFTYYPYSHSLVLTSIFAFIVGIILSFILKDITVVLIFTIASTTHWFLDIIVHNKDLPILGFSKYDKKVGFGLWNYGWKAFVIEYLFYALITVIFVRPALVLDLLLLGALFHIANINTFIAFTKKNPFAFSKYSYPIITLLGFSLFIIIATL